MRTFELKNLYIIKLKEIANHVLQRERQRTYQAERRLMIIKQRKNKLTPMTKRGDLVLQRERQRNNQAERMLMIIELRKNKFTPMTKKGDLVLQRERQRISMR